jgi:hypothetical protein
MLKLPKRNIKSLSIETAVKIDPYIPVIEPDSPILNMMSPGGSFESTPKSQNQLFSDHLLSPLETAEAAPCVSKILPWLILASEAVALDGDLLVHNRVKYVVNVAEETNTSYDPSLNLETLKLPWSHNQDGIISDFDKAFALFDRAKDENACALLHCHLGISRSATLAVAYVMYDKKMNLRSAYDYVRSIAPNISPNLHFMFQLYEYENLLFGK